MNQIQKESLHEIARHICNYFGNCEKCPLRHNELDICYDDQNFNDNQFEEWLLNKIIPRKSQGT